MVAVIESVAAEVFIPLTVGGGVCTIDDIRWLLNAGTDKVSINTAAVFEPEFVAGPRRVSDRSASWLRSTRSRWKPGRAVLRAGMCLPTADGDPRASMPSLGVAAWRCSAPVGFC